MKKLIPMMVMGCATMLTLNAADMMVAHSDKAFIMKAAQGGMTEVAAGKLAQDKASDQNLKDFGAMMVTDHGKANTELMGIASNKGVMVSDKLDAKHQKMVDKLSGESGAMFDKDYSAMMMKAHDMDLMLFKDEASSTKDSDLKNFASMTAETVQMHIDKLKDIKSKMMMK